MGLACLPTLGWSQGLARMPDPSNAACQGTGLKTPSGHIAVRRASSLRPKGNYMMIRWVSLGI